MGAKTKRSWVVISVTDQGQLLATSICNIFPSPITHIHKPTPFTDSVQNLFTQGYGLVFVCATGIVVRSLAAVIKSKFEDPPVLVLDELGQYVIPLLSGHEGQANQWAAILAGFIGAQNIVTTAGQYTQSSYVAGMGCIRGCSKQTLHSLLSENLQRLKLDPDNLQAISSISVKADEAGLISLAKELSVPFVVYEPTELRKVEDRLTMKSDVVFAEVGCYGVAESAAIFHAEIISGKPGQLLMPKIKNSQATLALVEVSLVH